VSVTTRCDQRTADAVSSDTWPAFVRSIAVATPTSLLRADRRAVGRSEDARADLIEKAKRRS